MSLQFHRVTRRGGPPCPPCFVPMTPWRKRAIGQARRPVPTVNNSMPSPIPSHPHSPLGFDPRSPMIHNRNISEPPDAERKLRASSNKGLTKPENLPHYHRSQGIRESSRPQGRPLRVTRISPGRWSERKPTGGACSHELLDSPEDDDPEGSGRLQQTSRGQRTQPTADHATIPPPVS